VGERVCTAVGVGVGVGHMVRNNVSCVCVCVCVWCVCVTIGECAPSCVMRYVPRDPYATPLASAPATVP